MNISNQGQHLSLLNLQSGNHLPEKGEIKQSNLNNPNRLISQPIISQNDHMGFIEPTRIRSDRTGENHEIPIKVNLRQVSLNEIKEIFENEDIKGGDEIIGELDVMPYWESPLETLNKNQVQLPNQYSQQKFDLLSKIENIIDTKRSANQSTNLLENALNKLNRFNEAVNSVKIDFLT